MPDKTIIDAFAAAKRLGYEWEADPERPGHERHLLYDHPSGVQWLRRAGIVTIEPATATEAEHGTVGRARWGIEKVDGYWHWWAEGPPGTGGMRSTAPTRRGAIMRATSEAQRRNVSA